MTEQRRGPPRWPELPTAGPRVDPAAVLRVVAFGVICEQDDGDPPVPAFTYSPAPAPEKAEAPDGIAAPEPNAEQARRRRFRGQFEYLGTVQQIPRWQRRLYGYRERRRKHVSLSFTEFADLSDGRRVTIRNDRGFGWSWKHSPGAWHGKERESLAEEVRNYYLAEEEECCPTSPERVVEHLQRSYDIGVDAASVEAALQLPLRVEFGTRLLQELPR